MGVGGTNLAGATVDAGLPNITGRFAIGPSTDGAWLSTTYASGCFKLGSESDAKRIETTGTASRTNVAVDFSASNSSSIYGNSNTVQPSAYFVYIWKRIE